MPAPVTLRQVNKLRSRHGRKKTGLSVCEGVRCCRELLIRKQECARTAFVDNTCAGSEIQEMCTRCRQNAIPVESVDPQEFHRLAQTENSQGILIVFDTQYMPAPTADDSVNNPDPFVLLLDQVQDPGNLGTILRSAGASALHEVWITAGTVDPFSPKSVRAGMGAQFSLILRYFTDVDAACKVARTNDYPRIWVTDSNGEHNCFDPDFDLSRSVLIIGNEAQGATPPPLPETATVRIPMPGAAESLNVAQATSILLFDAVRRGLLRSKDLPPGS